MTNPKWILLAEDNPNDADLVIRALAANLAPDHVVLARDGVEAIDCLCRRGEFRTRAAPGNPTMVLLDLKMPRMNGLEVLGRIKADKRLKTVPVVVFTSSREEADLLRSYELGANAYVVKPVGFREYVVALEEVRKFWMVVNEPAPEGTGRRAGLSIPPAAPLSDFAACES